MCLGVQIWQLTGSFGKCHSPRPMQLVRADGRSWRARILSWGPCRATCLVLNYAYTRWPIWAEAPQTVPPLCSQGTSTHSRPQEFQCWATHTRVIPTIREERLQTVWEKGTKEAFRGRPGQGEGEESRSGREPGERNGEGWSTGELKPVRRLGLPLHSVRGGRVEERELESLWVGEAVGGENC